IEWACRGSATPAARANIAAPAARICVSGGASPGTAATGDMRRGGWQMRGAGGAARGVPPCPPSPRPRRGRGPAAELAPLLCAGLIGYRAYRVAGEPRNLGLYGFGAAAHLLAQVARGQGRRVFAFTRPGDAAGQGFARELGAVWAGGSDERPHERLDAALRVAPAGALLPPPVAARRRANPRRARLRASRRARDMRRHSHERRAGVSVPAAVGRAFGVVGRES